MSLLLPSQIYATALFGVNSDPICDEMDQVATLGSPVFVYDYANIILKNSPIENSLQFMTRYYVSSTGSARRSADDLKYDIMIICSFVAICIGFYNNCSSS